MKTLLLTCALGMLFYMALPRDRGRASTSISKNPWQKLAKAETNSSRRTNPYQKGRTGFSNRMALHRPHNLFGPTQTSGFSDSMRQAWVSHYASRLLPGSDAAAAIAVDASGNAYVTGYIMNPPFGLDYLTVKYDPSGKQVWDARYDGEGSRDDMAIAIQVDAAGNVFVAGESYGAGTDVDYVTIKYNSAGMEQWIARYDGAAGLNDHPSALALDDAGNVYVTGFVSSSDYLSDFATVKYNANGVQQWVARYNGPGNDYDDAIALAVDRSGQVYVTGFSIGLDTGLDYATIKYSSSGAEQWVARYSSPEHYADAPSAIHTDGSGNVYVTGGSSGSNQYSDYLTIKYNSAGAEQWVARYNGPDNNRDAATDLSIDNQGNVYVTGWSQSSTTELDYFTVKYNGAGAPQWAARYNGPGNGWDEALAITIDHTGNAYVTGWSASRDTIVSTDYATIKYNAAGVEQWVVRYSGPGEESDEARALAVDSLGNVYVTGFSRGAGTSHDYATIKYNGVGVPQWVARYDGPGTAQDELTAMTIDHFGNVYVTGKSRVGTTVDFLTVKYNRGGVQEWVARYNGPENADAEPVAIAVDGAGNVYVTGSSLWSSHTDGDCITIKYNSSGLEQWRARYNGPGNGLDDARAMVLDKAGDVYVSGTSLGIGTGLDYVTIKYNASGAEQWVARYNGLGNSGDRACALALDDSGNIYVTGSSYRSSDFSEVVTIKYNSAGVQQWEARYAGPGASRNEATTLTVDGSGNVYVLGSSSIWRNYPLQWVGDYVTIKYNTGGARQWAAIYDGPGLLYDEPAALALDDWGNVYVTGRSWGGSSDFDYGTVKYNSTGKQKWVVRYNGSRDTEDAANNIAVDDSGNVCVTGYSQGDFATFKYDSAGAEKWRVFYDGSPEDFAIALAVNAAGEVYVAGNSQDNFFDWGIYTIIKYVEKQNDIPQHYQLSQNFPNPFNAATTIRYTLPAPGHVTLKVFNLPGEEVATLVNESRLAGEYEFRWVPAGLPSGIYIYRLQTGAFVNAKKLILLK